MVLTLESTVADAFLKVMAFNAVVKSAVLAPNPETLCNKTVPVTLLIVAVTVDGMVPIANVSPVFMFAKVTLALEICNPLGSVIVIVGSTIAIGILACSEKLEVKLLPFPTTLTLSKKNC